MTELEEELRDAYVFVDKAVHEVLEWTVGISFLVGLGIKGIDITNQAERYFPLH